MSLFDVKLSAERCLSVKGNLCDAEATCQRCGGYFYHYGNGGAVNYDGDIICEMCALDYILSDNRVIDLCEALDLEYIPASDVDEYMEEHDG